MVPDPGQQRGVDRVAELSGGVEKGNVAGLIGLQAGVFDDAGVMLDRVIGEHPSVHEAAAVAVPAELGEDDILVGVVLKPGQKASAQDITQWCRERLAPQKVPRYVLFVDELPHTPTGKVQKVLFKADKTLKSRAMDLG